MLNAIMEKPPLRIYDFDYSDNDEEVGIIQHNYNRRQTFIDKIINCVAYCDKGVECFFQALEWLNCDEITNVRKNTCVCIILCSPFLYIYYACKTMIFL